MILLIIAIGLALVGFVFGYFLAAPALVAATAIAAIVAMAWRPKREQELGSLIGVAILCMLGVTTITMWATHLYVTGFSFGNLGLPNLSKFVFRE